MRNRSKFIVVGASALALAAGGAGMAVANGGGEDASESEAPISGSALEQASSAAVDHLGDGKVTGTEVGDEESYYEVEVTRSDGSEVDVQLDRDFNVVGDESDANESSDESDANESSDD